MQPPLETPTQQSQSKFYLGSNYQEGEIIGEVELLELNIVLAWSTRLLRSPLYCTVVALSNVDLLFTTIQPTIPLWDDMTAASIQGFFHIRRHVGIFTIYVILK